MPILGSRGPQYARQILDSRALSPRQSHSAVLEEVRRSQQSFAESLSADVTAFEDAETSTQRPSDAFDFMNEA